MIDKALDWFTGGNETTILISLFLALVLGGLGFPIPEDIPLVFGGIAVANDEAGMLNVLAVCYIGVVAGDQLIYSIGYLFGPKLIKASSKYKLLPTVSPKRLEKFRKGWMKRGFVYILFARHFFPIRSATFLSAGILRVNYVKFLIADIFACAVTVGLMFSIGYFFGANVDGLKALFNQYHDIVWALFAIAALLFAIHIGWKFFAKKYAFDSEG